MASHPVTTCSQLIFKVVLDPSFLRPQSDAAYRYWVNTNRTVAANGSLMRTHPLGIMCIILEPEERFKIAKDYSIVTHVDPRCVVACCINTALISEIAWGRVVKESDVDKIINDAFAWTEKRYRPGPDNEPTPLDRQEFDRHVFATDFEFLQLDDSMKMGYVYKALGATILCLRLAIRQPDRRAHIFETLITDLIMLGGDADTNACCAGAVLGAWVGYSNLPAHWRDGMMHGKWLRRKTDAVWQYTSVGDGSYRGFNDPDTLTDHEKGLLTRETLEKREMKLMEKILLKDKERREAAMKKTSVISRTMNRFFGTKSTPA